MNSLSDRDNLDDSFLLFDIFFYDFVVFPIYWRKLFIDCVVVNSGRSKSACTKA